MLCIMIQGKKFSLSILTVKENIDSDISYSIVSNGTNVGVKSIENIDTWDFVYNPKNLFRIDIHINKEVNDQSHIKIESAKLNDITIYDLDLFSTYKTDQNRIIKNTNGYMACRGVFTIKIRYSQKVHQYMIHLFNSCKKNSI